jgi:hypothetical protein
MTPLGFDRPRTKRLARGYKWEGSIMMRCHVRALVCCLGIAALLNACGGGGGGGGESAPGPATAARAWKAPVLIETNNAGTVFNPRIAIDANGNALAVWDQANGASSNIYANRFTAASSTWGSAVLIETDNTGAAWAPQIAIGADGNALAVWSQYDGTNTSIWANRFNAASNAWSGAVLIEVNPGEAYDPRIAIAPDGNALAVWRQSDGVRFNVWANRFSVASNTWGSAVLIETDDEGDAHDPRIAIDLNGNAIVVWPQDDGNTTTNVWANRFAAVSNTWGSAQMLEVSPGDVGSRPQIAVGPNGDALAVWFQFDGARSDLWGNRFDATSNTWSGAALIESGAGSGDEPQVAIGTNGNALIVWSQSSNIWAKRFTSTSNTWGAAVLIELSSGEAARPRIAIDANGDAIAVWSQSDGVRSSIWANRFTAANNTWDSPNATLIEANNAGDAFFPEIAIDANGNALAIWRQSDGTRDNVWAARFD